MSELLKRELGEAIRREFRIEDAGLVTVNDVEVTGDLREARVFVSVLGTPDQQQRTLDLLEQKRPRLQDLVAHGVILKYTPRLHFVADDSVARGNHVLRIIEAMEQTGEIPRA